MNFCACADPPVNAATNPPRADQARDSRVAGPIPEQPMQRSPLAQEDTTSLDDSGAPRSGDEDDTVAAGESDEQATQGIDAPQADSDATATPSASWTAYGFDDRNSQNNTREKQLTADNVAELTEKWQVKVAGATGTPAVYDDTVYFGAWDGRLYAVSAQSGQAQWTALVSTVAVRSTPLVTAERVFVASHNGLVALDREDGSLIYNVEVDTHPLAMVDASPKLVDDMVILGAASAENTTPKVDYSFVGSINALDRDSGELVWRVETTGDSGGYCHGGAGGGVWSTPAIDHELGLLFVGTGQHYEEPTGNCTDALLAIHYARDHQGERVAWVRQYNQHDVYVTWFPVGLDGDVGASPNLFEANGKPLVGAGDKAGTYRVFDRRSGELEWRVDLVGGLSTGLGGVMVTAATDTDTIYVASNHWQSFSQFLGGDPDPEDYAILYALDMATGQSRWEQRLPAPMVGAISMANSLIYHSAVSGHFFARRAQDGEAVLSMQTGVFLPAGPSIVAGSLYVSAGGDVFPDPEEDQLALASVTAYALPQAVPDGPQVYEAMPLPDPPQRTQEQCEQDLSRHDPAGPESS